MSRKLTKKQRQELFAQANKFFVDIAKLVFAGIILAGIIKENMSIMPLLIGGIIAIGLSLWVAYVMFKNSKK